MDGFETLKKEPIVKKYINYLESNIPGSKISKSGNTMSIQVPKNISRKMVRLRVKKFLFKTFENKYRVIAMNEEAMPGFKIVEY